MSLLCAQGGPDCELSSQELQALISDVLDRLGPRKSVLAIPPDHTRFHSRAGELTGYVWRYYNESLRAVLPALGTHAPMATDQLQRMFGEVPLALFQTHNWRRDVETIGEVPADFVHEQSEGRLSYPWPAQVNRRLLHDGYDLILSIGQVVPHEVIGMANYNKNVLIGTGGRESINRSHYLGAVYGMERIMGRAEGPVRNVLNYAADRFLRDVPIVYVLTVIGRNHEGKSVMRGLFIGDDAECFLRASELSVQVNFEIFERPLRKVVVYLDPNEFHSTWLGNKAIYRTRMALDDDAELIILAPGVKTFGEDGDIDRLIRKYGYHGTEATLAMVARNPDLAADLSAAAHLIHGSSEGRFRITWCPGGMTREEIEGAGFHYEECATMSKKYDPATLRQGFNTVDGEEIFFVANPGLGLWAYRGRLQGARSAGMPVSQ